MSVMFAEPPLLQDCDLRGDWDVDFGQTPQATIDLIGPGGARMRVTVDVDSRKPAQLAEMERPDDIEGAADEILAANGYQRVGSWFTPNGAGDDTPLDRLCGDVPYFYGYASVTGQAT